MINFIISFNLYNFDTTIYYLQQSLSLLIYSQLQSSSAWTFIVLFIGGIITSLNPCLLSILPITISYINADQYKKTSKFSFLAGLLTSFLSIILFVLLLNKQYIYVVNKIPALASIGTILIGLNLLQILSFPSFSINARSINDSFMRQHLKDYIIGLILGLGSLPCSTPILITILLWLSSCSNFFLSIIYLNVYIAGYMIPLIILVNLTSFSKQALSVATIWNVIVSISGCFILGSGIFSLLENIFI